MDLFGRRDIYTSYEDITEDNVKQVLNAAIQQHSFNITAENYLYWYRRGKQPVLERSKSVRSDICNKIVDNIADEVVSFKNGYFLTQPATYIARGKKIKAVNRLNEFVYRSGKYRADNKVTDWFHTVGKGVLYVRPNDDPDVPFKVYSLDPRSAFVVYSLAPGNKPVFAVNAVLHDKEVFFDVVTKHFIFKLHGASSLLNFEGITADPIQLGAVYTLDSVEPNILGKINIIEYRYNTTNMAAFEAAIPLMDSLSLCLSNRIDGIEQFIQSLLVFYNCELGEDEAGNPITPEFVRAAGALFLKSVGENKADLREISSQLNQTETQVLVDYINLRILLSCGMPTSGNGGATINATGAAILARDNWYQADVSARNTEDLFRESNERFDKVILEILHRKGELLNLDASDFELHFVREETTNVQSRAQSFNTLLASGMHPVLAASKSGISGDPVADMEMSDVYLKLRWGDPNAKKAEQTAITEDPAEEQVNEVTEDAETTDKV